MAVAKPDLLLLELEAEMLKRVGSSLRRVKKRLVDTDLTFQLKPPETEALELANWEARVSSLVNYTDTMSFPRLLDFKRQFAARQHGIAKEAEAIRDSREKQRLARVRNGQEAEERLKSARMGKNFDVTKASVYFGGAIAGEGIKTIENYSGLNTVYGGPHSSTRILIRRDGRFTKLNQTSELPPWISAGGYANSDPPMFHELAEGVYTLPFKSRGRRAPPSGAKLRNDKISRRENLDSWKNRSAGPHFASTPEAYSREWVDSRRDYYAQPQQQALQDAALLRGSSRETPKIILGDITRQGLLVELEAFMRAKSSGGDGGRNTRDASSNSMTPTAAEQRLALQTHHRYSYVHTSPDISAKLERASNPDLSRMHQAAKRGGAWEGRKDFTAGGLETALTTPIGENGDFDLENTAANGENSDVADALLPRLSRSSLSDVEVGNEQIQSAPPISALLRRSKSSHISQRASDQVATLELPTQISSKSPQRLTRRPTTHSDPTGIDSLPLSSPIAGAIRKHMRGYAQLGPMTGSRSVNSLVGFKSSPEVNIRGILLGDGGEEDASYIAPSVTSTERERILAPYLSRNIGANDEVSAFTGDHDSVCSSAAAPRDGTLVDDNDDW